MTDIDIQKICNVSNSALIGCKLIPLNHDQFSIVDASDYEWLMQWKWHYRPNGYAARLIRVHEENPRRSMMMHRQILNTPLGLVTDHINGNRLDNRRCNLRICTESQNQCNRIKHKKATSIYKGVSKSSAGRAGWETMLYLNGKRQYIGHYPTEIDAALAYNAEAKKVFGEYANLNEVIIPDDFTPAPQKIYSSQYKGVCWSKASKKWMAKIKDKGKQIFLGLFASEEDAAMAYKNASNKLGVVTGNYNNKKLPK